MNKKYTELTKREYFAIIALQGLLSNINTKIDNQSINSYSKHACFIAVCMADQLFKELQNNITREINEK